MMRVARAVASAITLAALTVGVFFALLAFGRLPGWADLADLPGEMLTDTTAFALLTLLAWAAWATFTATVAVELTVEITGRRRWRLPANTPFQGTARRLVAAVTMSATLSGPLLARPGTPPDLAAAETTQLVHMAPASASTAGAAPDTMTGYRLVAATAPASSSAAPEPPDATGELPTVTVVLGDTPWGIADRHLGRGIRWREIWELNRGVPQTDGRAWITEDLIYPGWRLQLPGDAVDIGPPPAPPTPDPTGEDGTQPSAGSDAPTTTTSPDTEFAPAPAAPDTEVSTPQDGHLHADPTAPTTCEPDLPPSDSPTPAPATADAPPADDGTATPNDTSGSSGSSAPLGDHGEDVDDSTTEFPPILAGITGATVAATGLTFQIRRRRRRRTATTARVPWGPDSTDEISTERAVASASDLPLIHWAGHHLAALIDHPPRRLNGGPVAVELSADTGIELLWDTPNPTAPPPWTAADGGWAWRLAYDPEATVPLNDQPAGIPGLVTVGQRDGRQLLIDLEAFGAVAIDGDPDRVADLARAITFELGAGEELASAQVILAGLEFAGADRLPRIHTASAEDALARLQGTTATINDALDRSHSPSTFDYRTGDAWTDVTAVVVAGQNPQAVALVEASTPRRAVATIVAGPAIDATARITADTDGAARLEPLGLTFHAAGLPAESAADVAALLDALDRPTTAEGSSTTSPEQVHLPVASRPSRNGASEAAAGEHAREPGASPDADRDNDDSEDSVSGGGTAHDDTTSDEPAWPQLLVKVLGRPHVPDRPKLRRRELTLAVYLACKGQPTPATSVQHAVWNGRAVQTKTIWNVATATRAALGQLDDGTPAMPASQRAHNTLALAPGVRTDLQLLQDLYDSAQHAPSTRAIELLQQGVDLIEGQPFDGPDFEWAHHTELLVAHATRLIEGAVEHLVELATSAGRGDLARHAITQGLRALPGNEVLYRARMTVEHDDGNLAAVRSAYEELVSFLADIDAEPSQATITLYRQLRPQPGRHAS